MTTNKIQIPLIMSGIFFLGSILIPNIAFEDLAIMRGYLVSFVEKKTAGFTIVIDDNRNTQKFNIPNSTIEINSRIRNLRVGDEVQVMYDPRYSMKGGSYDVWQFEYRGSVLISYEDEAKVSTIYSRMFMVLSLVSMLLYLLLKFRQCVNDKVKRGIKGAE